MTILDAKSFGLLVRTKRKALGLSQEDLATASGTGDRFIGDLEAGKPSCQLDKALLVARAVGIQLVDVSKINLEQQDLPDEEDELGYVPKFR